MLNFVLVQSREALRDTLESRGKQRQLLEIYELLLGRHLLKVLLK
jgi:hypothetical protein